MRTASRTATRGAFIHAAIVSGVALLAPSSSPAEPVAVAHAEGLAHGFLALPSLEGTTLADGDLIQTSGSQHQLEGAAGTARGTSAGIGRSPRSRRGSGKTARAKRLLASRLQNVSKTAAEMRGPAGSCGGRTLVLSWPYFRELDEFGVRRRPVS